MTLAQRISYWLRTVVARRRDVVRRRKQAIKAMKRYHADKTAANLKSYTDAKRRLAASREALATAEHALKKAQGEQSAKPRIVRSGLACRNLFGPLGPETKATTHYAASPRAKNLSEGLKLAQQFHAFHASKGWGGIAYHFLIPDSGEIILGRPVTLKGAHVLNTNSNNVGINFFCTEGDKPTEAQKRSVKWLIANAHTSAMPSTHRTDRDLRHADIRGHKFWPGQSTGCPGNFTPQNLGIR